MTLPLLATKLHIPAWRESDLLRPRILACLNAGLAEGRKLSLISAPAGYGKTTLLSGWLHGVDRARYRVAWLSLDEADHQPERFFAYFLASLAGADDALRPLLARTFPPDPSALLDEIINHLTATDCPLLLILEDYHFINRAEIHNALEYFIDHQPACVHLVIATRQDPPLPIPRLRAQRHLTELRARDLRFTPQEARQFFAQSMQIDLTDDSAQALEQRTEGWAVGLQLAGLALRDLPSPHSFIETFRGSHRYILDYLADEVLQRQPLQLRAFLTQTSLLKRFNADLCHALTAQADAQQTLLALEQSNLFIAPLDDERGWYRYHRLFADYLQTLLAPDEAASLSKRASAWHERHGLMEEAVAYAQASADPDFMADVIGRVLTQEAAWSGGNLHLLTSWLDALPPAALRGRPRLCLDVSRILYLAGSLERAGQHIDLAEAQLTAQPSAPEAQELRALAQLYRGCIASVRGDAPTAITLISAAQEHLPHTDGLLHARAAYSLGMAYQTSAQADRAVAEFLRASDMAHAAGVLFLAIHARCAAAQVQITQGRLQDAAHTARHALQMADGARIPPLGLVDIILGEILLEQNQLAAAQSHLSDGTELARAGGLTSDVILGLTLLARLHAVQGDEQAAFAAADQISALQPSAAAAALRARLHLFHGRSSAASQWAAQWADANAAVGEPPDTFTALTLARVWIANGKLDHASALLLPLLAHAHGAGSTQTEIEARLLLALLHHAQGKSRAAQDAFCQSLQLAAPQGYVRLFLDEGAVLLALLPGARSCAPELVDNLLDALRAEHQPAPSPLAQLPDPLSEQEMRVLTLVVAGHSNQEIAAQLFISAGTAKWHVHNILQKLEVKNRPQAIARARALGF